MAEDETLVDWYLRKFPEELKIKCQQLAIPKKMTDPEIVAFYVKKGIVLEALEIKQKKKT